MPKRHELKFRNKGAEATALRARQRRGLPKTATAQEVARQRCRDWYAKRGQEYRAKNAKRIALRKHRIYVARRKAQGLMAEGKVVIERPTKNALRVRRWRAANIEKVRAYGRAYYVANREKQYECLRAWRAANIEKVRAYGRDYQRQYYAANRETLCAYQRDYQRQYRARKKAEASAVKRRAGRKAKL